MDESNISIGPHSSSPSPRVEFRSGSDSEELVSWLLISESWMVEVLVAETIVGAGLRNPILTTMVGSSRVGDKDSSRSIGDKDTEVGESPLKEGN
jgi:hypothetical protein